MYIFDENMRTDWHTNETPGYGQQINETKTKKKMLKA